jgi:RimJ/RimL family protein N-acetyltransferase
MSVLPPVTEIRTKRLLLRPARRSDLTPLHAILSDTRAMAFWCTPPHPGLDETREWLESMIAIRPDEGEDFIVEHEGEVIGKTGLHRFPEIGFIFHPRVWGRGIAAEALAPVLDRAFAVHALPAVRADVDPRNSGSLRLLARFGFRETERKARTWLVGDQWCDSVYLELDAPG